MKGSNMLTRPRTSVHTDVYTITPLVAEEWLEHNPINRPINTGHVEYLAQQMRQGLWQLNGESIVIADTGEILDGQHRLLAVAKSKVTIRSVVSRGVSKACRFTVDTGQKRTAGNALAMLDVPNYNAVAAVVRSIHILAYRNISYRCPPAHTANFNEVYGEQLQQTAHVYSKPQAVPMKWLAALHFIANVYLNKGDVVYNYINVFTTGIAHYSLEPAYDPAHIAREILLRYRLKSTVRMREQDHIGLILRSWDDFLHGENRRTKYPLADLNMSWDIEGFSKEIFEADLKAKQIII